MRTKSIYCVVEKPDQAKAILARMSTFGFQKDEISLAYLESAIGSQLEGHACLNPKHTHLEGYGNVCACGPLQKYIPNDADHINGLSVALQAWGMAPAQSHDMESTLRYGAILMALHTDALIEADLVEYIFRKYDALMVVKVVP